MWLYLILFRRLKYSQRNMEIKWIMQKHIRIEPFKATRDFSDQRKYEDACYKIDCCFYVRFDLAARNSFSY